MHNDSVSTIISLFDDINKENLRSIIKAIPANMFFKDTECRYQMVSKVCEMLNQGDKDWTIIGKTDLEIQTDPEIAQIYYEDDKKIIATGKGSHYVSEMEFNGIKYYFEISKEPVYDNSGCLLGIVGLVNDISEIKRLQYELYCMSFIDKLTGSYNRNYYEQKKQKYMSEAALTLSVIMCDTNCLKFVNDNFGHSKGDELLAKTAHILNEVVGDHGEVMRIGGDEFIVFCEQCSEDKCKELVGQIKDKEQEYQMMGVRLSNSYGYAALVENNIDIESAINVAEKMMYAEKKFIKPIYLSKLRTLCNKMEK